MNLINYILNNNIQKTFKNGFYLDFYFKKFIFIAYKKIIGVNTLYLLDKYLAEKFIFSIKTFSNYSFYVINIIKNLTFNQIIKLSLILIIQLMLLFIL